MRLLVDTHLLLWSADNPRRLSMAARNQIVDGANDLWFSVVSIWEVAIKRRLRRPDFEADPRKLRDGLLANGYTEVGVTGPHALAVLDLAPLHGDPFDRMLVAQAGVEGLTLITADRALAGYGAPVRLV